MGDKQNFIESYRKLSINEAPKAREEIIRLNNWKSSAHFYMKANGKRSLSTDERVIVSAVLKSYKIDWS